MTNNKIERIYKNRYNDEIIFTKIGVETIELTTFNFYRIGYVSNTKNIDFIDLSGGPFLKVGESIKNYTGWELKINKIVDNSGQILLTVEKI